MWEELGEEALEKDETRELEFVLTF